MKHIAVWLVCQLYDFTYRFLSGEIHFQWLQRIMILFFKKRNATNTWVIFLSVSSPLSSWLQKDRQNRWILLLWHRWRCIEDLRWLLLLLLLLGNNIITLLVKLLWLLLRLLWLLLSIYLLLFKLLLLWYNLLLLLWMVVVAVDILNNPNNLLLLFKQSNQ